MIMRAIFTLIMVLAFYGAIPSLASEQASEDSFVSAEDADAEAEIYDDEVIEEEFNEEFNEEFEDDE